MNNHNLREFPHVPTVGQPFKIVAHYPTILIQCQCEAKAPILLVGMNGSGPCPACGKVYGIGKVGGCEVGLLATSPSMLS